MKFYDFWVEEIEENLIGELGFENGCFISEFKKFEDYKRIKEHTKFYCGVKIRAKNTNELRKKLRTFRDSDFIVLDCRDEKIIKNAIKMCAVDAINYYTKYPLLKRMSERNIAQIINFNELLNASEKDRPKILFLMQRTIKLAKKYKTPIMIVSGARKKMEYRSASDLIALGEMLGLNKKEAKEALHKFHEKIIERIKLKKEGKWIRPGVREV